MDSGGTALERALVERCSSKLQDLVTKTSASADVHKRADAVLQRSVAHFMKSRDCDEDVQYWAACALMAASCPTKPLSISKVMKAAGGQMKVTDFLEWTKLAACSASQGKPAEAALQKGVHRMERAFAVTAHVFRKFRSIYRTIVDPATLSTVEASGGNDKLFRTVWLFFVYAKTVIFRSGNERSPLLDNVPAFHFLVATLIWATHARESIQRSLEEAEEGPRRKHARMEHGVSDDPIRSFCNTNKALFTETAGYLKSIEDAIPVEVLSCFPLDVKKPLGKLDFVFDTLTRAYESALEHPNGDGFMDERQFTDDTEFWRNLEAENKAVCSPVKSPRGRPNREGITIDDGRGDALDALAAVAFATPRSPTEPTTTAAIRAIQQTPVSVGVIAVRWLQNLVASRPETPGLTNEEPVMSPILARFVSHDQWREIYSRALELLHRTMQRIYAHSTVTQRTREAMALYFLSLEGILTSEEKRLKRRTFGGLLSNDTFHRALLACSAESACIAYGRRDFAPFPRVLDEYKLDPFDLTKVVESFLRHTRGLPRTVARHLARCEERVLESLVWRPNSLLVRTLKQREEKFLADEANGNSQGSGDMPLDHQPLSQGSQDMYSASQLSEGSQRQHLEDTKEAMAVDDGGENELERTPSVIPEAALEIFVRKMLFISSERVQDLASKAGLSPSQAEHVWAAMKMLLSDKWRLLVGRHLDQMIMCCVYGVAKVNRNGPKPSFMNITHWYRTLQHTREPLFQDSVHAIYYDVLLTSTVGEEETRGDIIMFYNKIFVQQMKSFLLKHQSRTALGDGSNPSGPKPTAAAGGGGAADPGHDATTSGDVRDPIKTQISHSPMRVRRSSETPTRVVGKVTVTAMSPHGRKQMSRLGLSTPMTPGTRTLYSFGESPIVGLHGLNRCPSQGRRLRLGDTNAHEGGGEGAAVSSMRRKYADVFSVAPAGSLPSGPGLPSVIRACTSKPPLPPGAANPTITEHIG